MSEISVYEYFQSIKQGWLAGAEANSRFQRQEFVETIKNDLVDTGFAEDLEYCNYRNSQGNVAIDGYWFGDDGQLDLYIADFDSRQDLEVIGKVDIEKFFKRARHFFIESSSNNLAGSIEMTSPAYGPAKRIQEYHADINRVRIVLLSERRLSDRVTELLGDEIGSVKVAHEVWDISRMYRQSLSTGRKEPLEINLKDFSVSGLPCLRAHFGGTGFESYLIVAPARAVSSF